MGPVQRSRVLAPEMPVCTGCPPCSTQAVSLSLKIGATLVICGTQPGTDVQACDGACAEEQDASPRVSGMCWMPTLKHTGRQSRLKTGSSLLLCGTQHGTDGQAFDGACAEEQSACPRDSRMCWMPILKQAQAVSPVPRLGQPCSSAVHRQVRIFRHLMGPVQRSRMLAPRDSSMC